MFKLLCMKRYFWVLLLLAPFYTTASHVAGGDIEYENIGPRQWKVRLTIYRECTGATLCISTNCSQTMVARPNVSLNPAGCVSTPSQVNFILSLVSVQDAESFRKQACPTFKNGCTNIGQVTAGNNTPSIEKYVFEGILNLNLASLDTTSCSYWDIYWELCCRNAGIINLASSGDQGIRITSTINIFNRSQGVLKNNSPTLTNEAVLAVQSGTPQSIAVGAVDPDGDSLTYAIESAKQHGGIPVVYQAPYSMNVPFPLNSIRPPHIYYPQPTGPYIIIDSTTGDIQFNALNNTPQFILGTLNLVIKQWNYDSLNNPLLVGITQRELQYYVLNAPSNNPPKIRTIPANTGNTPIVNYTVCAGQQLCFNVIAHDTDFYPNISRSDTTTLSWNNGIVRPGKLTFGRIDTVNRQRLDQWQFCWQTEDADARNLPYQFTVTAADNFCPWIGRTTQTFSIKVLPRAAFDKQQELLQCNRLVYKVRKTNTKQFFSSATVQIANQPNDFTFASGSRFINAIQPNPVALTGVALDTPRVIISDTFSYPKPGKYFVRVTVNTPGAIPGQFCSRIITDTISIDSLITVSVQDTLVCRNSAINIVAQTTGADTLTYTWYKNALSTNPILGPSTTAKIYQATDSVPTKYYVKVQGGFNCTVIDSMMLRIDPRPSFRIVNPIQCLSNNNSFTVVDTSKITKPYTRLWLLPNNTTSTDSAVTFNHNAVAGVYQVKLVTTSSKGCVDTALQTITINPRPNAVITYTDTTICAGDTTYFTAQATANHSYQWFKNGSIINGQTALNYSATISGGYRFVITSQHGCKDTSSVVNVVVSNKPVIGSVAPSNICASTPTLNLPNRTITPTNLQGGTSVWSMSSTPNAISGNTLNVSELDGLPQDTFYTNMGTNVAAANRGYYINYQYTSPLSAGACSAKDSILVRIFALPKTTAGRDTAYCYENGLMNLANYNHQPKETSGKIGVWSLVSGSGLVVNNVSPSLTTYNFNTKAAVVNSDMNKLRYVYTQTYNQAPIVSNLSCSQSDTVIIRVIKGWADAGLNQEFCSTNELIDVRLKQGISTRGMFTDSLLNPITYFNIQTAAKFPFVNKLRFVEDSSGCAVKDSVYYIVYPTPIISGGSDETFCGSGIITFANKQNVNPIGGTFYNTNQQQVTTFDVATAAVLPQENKFIYQIPVSSGSVVCLGTDTFVYVVVPAAQLTSISGNLTPIKNTIQTYTTNANPYHNYSWQITGGQIQSNAQNSVTILWGNAGSGNIKVIARHPSCTDVELNQQVQITPSTGLTEQAIMPNLLIYPNPANNSVTVSFESDKTAQIELLNAMMQNITEYNVLSNQGSVEKEIPTSMLSSGLYFIRIQVNGQSGMYKLVISR